MQMAVVSKLKEYYIKMDAFPNLEWVNDVDIANTTVDAIPMRVIEGIKAYIEQYLIDEEFGSAYRQDIRNIIDCHIKEYTE